MTTEVYPFPDRQTNPQAESVLSRFGSANFVVPSDKRLFGGVKPELDEINLNGFEVLETEYTLLDNVKIELSSGEALINGYWVAKDEPSTLFAKVVDGENVFLSVQEKNEKLQLNTSFSEVNKRRGINIGQIKKDNVNETATIEPREQKFLPRTASLSLNGNGSILHFINHRPNRKDDLSEDYIPSKEDGSTVNIKRISQSVSANSSTSVQIFSNSVSDTTFQVYADIGSESANKSEIDNKSVVPIDTGTQNPKVELINKSNQSLTITATVLIIKVSNS